MILRPSLAAKSQRPAFLAARSLYKGMEDKPPKQEIRPARFVEYKGEMVKLKQLAKDHGINPRTLTCRIDEQGMSLEEALVKPILQDHQRRKARPPKPGDKMLSTRQRIVETLMDTFFEDPREFERWVEEQKKRDYGKFYKDFIVPFLPKEVSPAMERGQQKAIITIEVNNTTTNPSPKTFIAGKVIDP